MKSLSRVAKLFLFVTYLAGIVILLSHIGQIEFNPPWLLLVLCILASLGLILEVDGSTDQSRFSFSFIIYGFSFVLLGPGEAIIVILAAHIVELIWKRSRWYYVLFNMSSDILGMEAAGLIYTLINQENSPHAWQNTLGILIGLAVFCLFNHLMVGIIIWLANQQSLKSSGVFDFLPLTLDLALLYFGASLSIAWMYNPASTLLFVIPTYMLYNALRVPELERKTEIDSKTGLFNQSYFKKRMNEELARANRSERPMSVIIADLDLLRNINNSYGHIAGDEVLIGVAKTMKQAVREYDVVSRFGGEEFAILLPETTLLHAYKRAEELRRAIEQLEFNVPTSTTPIRATMSFGVAHREKSGQTPNEIIHNADLALYNSKLKGRNRTCAHANDSYIDLPAINQVSATALGDRPDTSSVAEWSEI